MNTKLLMICSSIFMGIIGFTLLFLPEEIETFLQIGQNSTSTMFLKLLSALMLGFAFLNWMAKSNLIGGIYSRPVVIGNFTHFVIGFLSLIKLISPKQPNNEVIILLALAYGIFTFFFGFIFFKTPNLNSKG